VAGWPESIGDAALGAAAMWRWAIATVLAGHLLAIAFPASVLFWNREPLRLFVLEGTGVAAGCIALVGLLAMLVQRWRAADHREAASPLETIGATLISIEVASGIAVAVLYRWASSWSGVTLTPYLLSLFRLEPRVALVASMPFAVRLHVFCAFAVVAVAPFTPLTRVVVLPRGKRARPAIGGLALAWADTWRTLGSRWRKHARLVSAVFAGNEEREN